jgi:N-acetylglucosamine-6-phosphate deacetylase
VELPKHYTGPGLVDLQVNGFAGFDFNSDPEDWLPETWHEIRERLMGRGVVMALPTFITDAPERLVSRAQRYAELIEGDEDLARFFPRLHIEGPFISPETGPRGAHPIRFCETPRTAPNLMQRIWDGCGGRVSMVTLAPELPGALDLIASLTDMGVTVALGHTNATTAQLDAGVHAGAKMSTHLGNGSHPMLPRLDNYVQAQLADDRLHASFIADGHHMPFHTLKNFLRAKTPARAILASDSISAADLGPGRHQMGEAEIEVAADLRTSLAGHDGLAGSATPLDRAVLNTCRHCGVTFEEAWDMASTHPAAVAGLRDPETITVDIMENGFALSATLEEM